MTQQFKNTLKQLELNAITKQSNKVERTLSKTEFTIIITCILFITLLTFINIIIYAIRKYLIITLNLILLNSICIIKIKINVNLKKNN